MQEGRFGEKRMSVRSGLQALAEARDDSTIVVTNQGSARIWPLLAEHPLDFHYNPSTMGGAIPFGLGLALAQPSLHVIVVSGDGALTMSLGSLISAAAAGPGNLTIVVLDNGMYEVTGGQRTAASAAQVDYAALARAVGFPSAFVFDDETNWRREILEAINSPGPRLIAIRVEAALPADMSTSLPPVSERLARISEAIRRCTSLKASERP
jgi:sulfopyruvate decarboxylase subunit beta